MTIPKAVEPQRDFSAGELDPDAERRDDVDIHKAGLKKALNTRPLDVKGITRRQGRRIRYYETGLNERVSPVSEIEFDVTLKANRFVARDLTGAVVSDLAAPWTLGMLPELDWELNEKEIYVTHRSMPTQVITYDSDAGTWSIADFSFLIGLSGETRIPFYRFADFGVTMTPSALTGSITITFSAPVLESQHVGLLFRYAERQIQIDSITDSQNAAATVIEELPRTQRLTVPDIEGYSVGEVVEGDTTNTVGEIVAVAATTVDVVITKNLGGFKTSDTLIGPNARSTVSNVADITPGASVQWDEQFISEFRGYPGAVSKDRKRLVLCDFEQFPEAVLWSAIDAPTDFKTTGTADGSIFEYVPDTGRVYAVVGGADQFVFTDRRVYYIPISGSTPLAPGSVEFRRIASEGAARVRPVAVSDGAVFVSSKKTRIMAVSATGQQTRPYIVQPISRFHGHLVKDPIAIAAASGAGGVPGEALYCVNADGTMIVARYDEGDEWVGWFPWDGAARITDVRGGNDQILMTVAYDLGMTIEAVEEPDGDVVMDGIIDLMDPADTGLLPFAGETVDVMSKGGFYLGQALVDGGGNISVEGFSNDDLLAGHKFTVDIRPFIDNFEGGEDFGQRMRRRKVAKVVLTYRDTQAFRADGRPFAGYVAGENVEGTRPERSDTDFYRQTGRDWDPTVIIQQDVPGKFKLIELTVKVTV